MKTMYKYFFKELTVPVIFGISMFTFLFLIDYLIEMMENIIVKNVPAVDVIEMISYYFPPILSNTIPMGVFFGVMIAYNRLSQNSELVAMQSVGVGFMKFMKPAMILGIMISLVVFFIEEKVIPDSYIKLGLIMKKIAYTRPALKLEEKTFVEDIGDHSIYIDHMDNEANAAENLVVFQKVEKSMYPRVVMAKKARWENSAMILEDANFYNIDSNGEKELGGSFEKQIVPINTFFGDFTIKGRKKRDMMSISELYIEIKDIYGEKYSDIKRLQDQIKEIEKNIKKTPEQKEKMLTNIKNLKKQELDLKESVKKEKSTISDAEKRRRKIKALPFEAELHQKLAVPFSAVLLATLGVFLSVKKSRSGKGASFPISILLIFSYMLLMGMGKRQSIKQNIDVVLAMWFPNLILFSIIIILFVLKKRRGE